MQIRDLLKEKGLDGEVLLAFVLGRSREFLFANGEIEVGGADVARFLALWRRRMEGEPVAYLIGSKEFYGLDFFVDGRVLIPRPETEELVAQVVKSEKLRVKSEGLRVLDVGTGSGAIAVSIAVNLPEVSVVAVDFSGEALEVARENARRHGVSGRVRLLESDLLTAIEDGECFEVICANLPYIGEVKHRHVDENVEKFEPRLALFAGEDGLDLYRRLFLELREKGVSFDLMLCEFGFGQCEDMGKLAEEFFPGKWRILKDLAGIERILEVASTYENL